MFEPPVAGNLKPSGDVKMEVSLCSRYRSPLNQNTEGDTKRRAGCVCVKVQAGGVLQYVCVRESTSLEK